MNVRRLAAVVRLTIPELRCVSSDDEVLAIIVEVHNRILAASAVMRILNHSLVLMALPTLGAVIANVVFVLVFLKSGGQTKNLKLIYFIVASFIGIVASLLALIVCSIPRQRSVVRVVMFEYGYPICPICGCSFADNVTGKQEMKINCKRCGSEWVWYCNE